MKDYLNSVNMSDLIDLMLEKVKRGTLIILGMIVLMQKEQGTKYLANISSFSSILFVELIRRLQLCTGCVFYKHNQKKSLL